MLFKGYLRKWLPAERTERGEVRRSQGFPSLLHQTVALIRAVIKCSCSYFILILYH